MGVEQKTLTFGSFPAGERNLITDVPGVRVGHVTLSDGDVQTGVTAIIPAEGNLFAQKVPAACHVINGFGKAAGLVQVQELGTIETPIVLTNTFGVGTGVNALIRYSLADNEDIGLTTGTVNPVVLECNDGRLNDIRGMHVTEGDVNAALAAASDRFAEGAVGAGRGMCCYGLKGGIGSASRVIEIGGKAYAVGALLLTNFGQTVDLRVGGSPLGQKIAEGPARADKGSCVVILATDIPLSCRQMGRVCRRAQSGLARTGAYISSGSGEMAVMFSTGARVPHYGREAFATTRVLQENLLDLVFRAVADCVEESVISSMLHAETVTGRAGNQGKSLGQRLEECGITL